MSDSDSDDSSGGLYAAYDDEEPEPGRAVAGEEDESEDPDAEGEEEDEFDDGDDAIPEYSVTNFGYNNDDNGDDEGSASKEDSEHHEDMPPVDESTYAEETVEQASHDEYKEYTPPEDESTYAEETVQQATVDASATSEEETGHPADEYTYVEETVGQTEYTEREEPTAEEEETNDDDEGSVNIEEEPQPEEDSMDGAQVRSTYPEITTHDQQYHIDDNVSAMTGDTDDHTEITASTGIGFGTIGGEDCGNSVVREEIVDFNDSFARVMTSDYNPSGQIKQLGPTGINSYVVGDPTSRKCILIFSDAIGIHNGRHKLVADEFANLCGYYVVMPDFFDGNPPLSSEDDDMNVEFLKTITNNFKYSDLEHHIVESIYPFCRDGQGKNARKIFALGFGYGAYLWTFAAANPKMRFQACASPSPDIVKICDATGDNYKKAFKNYRCPIMLVNTEKSPKQQKADGKIQNILYEIIGLPPSEFHVQFDINSGKYSIRGDVSDDLLREAMQAAYENFVRFFDRYSGDY